MRRNLLPFALGIAASLLGVARAATPPASKVPAKKAAELARCAVPAETHAQPGAGDPRLREAAQRGLAFLGKETRAWHQVNNCYGCHVDAVTLEALAVGKHHQYRVPSDDIQFIVDAMTKRPGGSRGPIGLSYHDASLPAPSKAFGGAAFARADEWLPVDLRKDLLKAAAELIPFQQEDGSIRLDWTNMPVGDGAIQGTYQAAQTWRQAYSRTADDKWLLPIARAEKFLAASAKSLLAPSGASTANIQDINYALMGLVAAGVGTGEPIVVSLEKQLVSREKQDGGWSFLAGETSSSAFPTGQTLYTLRLLGRGDGDAVVTRGTRWLLDHQSQDGGWSHAGFGKAEAMWGVLGLVSVDVLSVSVAGLEDGQHVDGTQKIHADARDNHGGGVLKVELAIDDIPVDGACGATLDAAWDTRTIEAGKHTLDVIATNVKGQQSRRRVEVYAGNVFLTQLGARSTDSGTEVSLRDIAPKASDGKIEVEILSSDKDGKPGKPVATVRRDGAAGALSVQWDGKDSGGKQAPRGKYFARVKLREGERVVQTEDLLFVRDTEAQQHDNFAEVSGNLHFAASAAPASNAKVDLVDDRGNVVQSTRSTAAGQYRFKNVDQGKYHVRIQKEGYGAVDKPVDAKKAADAESNAAL